MSPAPTSRPPLRVAVVGSGLAGLTTAYLLRREGAEVYLIEKSDKLGFHSASVDIPREPSATDVRSQARKGQSDCASQGEASAKPGGRPEGSSKQHEERSESWTVDVPMRSFQGGYYPLLIALYRHLGLPLKKVYYNYSFSHLVVTSPSSSSNPARSPEKPLQSCYFIYSGASGRSAPALPSMAYEGLLDFLRAILNFLSLALCFLLLLALAFLSWHGILPPALSRPNLSLVEMTESIASILARPLPLIWTPLGDVWRRFVVEIIIPLFSAVGTMTDADVLATPIEPILEYVHTTLGTPHYTLDGCSAKDVAAVLVAAVTEQGDGFLRLGTELTGLTPRGHGLALSLKLGDELLVDRVVVATQPKAAAAVLKELESSLLKRPVLGGKDELKRVRLMLAGLAEVKSRETIVVTHRDESILPDRADRRNINLALPILDRTARQASAPAPPPASASSATPYFPPTKDNIHVMATHIMSPPFLSPGQSSVLQTTNPVVPIDQNTILAVARLERALPSHRPRHVLPALHPRAAPGHTPLVYLAGSYAYPGIPLLEGCVGSAKRVVEDLLARSLPEPEEEGAGRSVWQRGQSIGGVDWRAGEGSLLGRVWRWRRKSVWG